MPDLTPQEEQDLEAIGTAHGPLVKELVARARGDAAWYDVTENTDNDWDDPDYKVSDIVPKHYSEAYYAGSDHTMTEADYAFLLAPMGNRPINTGGQATPDVRTFTRVEKWLIDDKQMMYGNTDTTGDELIDALVDQAIADDGPMAFKFLSLIASISLAYGMRYAGLNSVLLIQKFLGKKDTDSDVGKNFNVFYKGGADAVLGAEIQAFALDIYGKSPAYDQYSYAQFNNVALDYLRGKPAAGKIFEDHNLAGKTASDGTGYRGQWPGAGSTHSIYIGQPPPEENPVRDVLMMTSGLFQRGGGVPAESAQNVWKDQIRALDSVWAGSDVGDRGTTGTWGAFWFDLDLIGSFWRAVGQQDPADYSKTEFGRPTDWSTLTSLDVDDNVPQVMPLEIKTDKKTINNSDRKALTGNFEKDTDNQGSWDQIPAIKQKFDAECKQPKGRLPKEWFNDIKVAYPSAEAEKELPFNVNLPAAIADTLPDFDPGAVSGTNGAVVLPNAHGMSFGEKVFNRFYVGYYMVTMHYMMLPHHSAGTESSVSQGNQSVPVKPYTNEDIWQWCCFKTACYLNQLWTQHDHDVYIADLYAVIVALYQTDPEALKALTTDQIDALFADIEKAADDSAKATAEDLPDELIPSANKDQRERLYKQCALLLNMHKPAIKGRNNRYTGLWHKHAPNGGGAYNHRMHIIEAGDTTSMSSPLYQSNNFINRLLSPNYKQIKPFLDMPNWMRAGLVPTMKLYKVFREADKLTEVEFIFPTAPGVLRREAGITGLLDSRFDRGDGVGLKEFTWEYDGETPATASKYINARLSLFFQTFTDFTAVRGCDDKKYRFVDLFASPACAKERKGIAKPHGLQYDPEYYRIKIEVGYHWDPAMKVPYDQQDRLKNALFFLRQVFSLVLVDNEININEDGTVNITASYRAYIEEAVDSFKFNALNTMEVRNQREQFKREWEAATAINETTGKPECGERQINIIRDKMNARLRQLTKIQHRSVMETLLKREKIYYIDFAPEHIEEFRKLGRFKNIPTFRQGSDMTGISPGPGATFRDWLDKQKGAHPEEFSDPAAEQIAGDYRAYYFYLSDLVYFVTSNLYESGEGGTNDRDWLSGAENTRVILTDFQYYNSVPEPPAPGGAPAGVSDALKVMNMADIPISVDFFTRWYIENVVRMEVEAMPIGSFIRRMLVELVSEALAEVCISDRADHHVLFNMATLLAGGVEANGISHDPISFMLQRDQDKVQRDDNGDGVISTGYNNNMTQYNSALDERAQNFGIMNRLNMHAVWNPDVPAGTPGNFPLSPIPSPPDSGIANQWNYILLYSTFRNPAHPGTGNREIDSRNGVYHIDIGRDRGLVKKVSFSKNNIKYHRESRMMNQGAAGLSMLSAVYDCKVDMIGNTLFLPGQEFWLNPYGFGGEAFGKPQDAGITATAPSSMVCSANGNAPIPGAAAPSAGTTGGAIVTPTTVVPGSSGGGAPTPAPDPNMCYINSYSNVMGIGGYQQVTKVECKIAPGEYKTTVSAKFIYSGRPDSANQQAKKLAQGQANVTDVDYTGDPEACDNVIRQLEIYERGG